MRKRTIIFWMVLLTTAGLLGGCGASADTGENSSEVSEVVQNQADSQNENLENDIFNIMMQEHFPDSLVYAGMPVEEYPEEPGEAFELYPGGTCYSAWVESIMNTGTYAGLYFLEKEGLAMLELSSVGFDEWYITDICGEPMAFWETEMGANYYWMFDDVLLIYDTDRSDLVLYTEACAEQICPQELLLAKTGLLLYETIFDELYWYQDLSSGNVGLYDAGEDTMLTEACYQSFKEFDEAGMVPVKMDGYWGYINADGENVIGHYFEDAETFSGACAAVKSGGNWGAIDSQGNYVVQPEYIEVRIDEEFIIVKNQQKYYGVYDQYGKELIKASTNVKDERYEKIYVVNDLIYAGSSKWYDVYDRQGNALLGTGALSNVLKVTLPQNGYHILRVKQIESQSALGTVWKSVYTFADEELNIVGVKYYEELTGFSKNGYAIGKADDMTWEVIGTDGTVYHTLGQLGGTSMTFYEQANSFMVSAYYTLGTGQNSTRYGVVDLNSGVFTEYADVKPLGGTEYMIVTANSGLMGLYEKNELIFGCVYDDIDFDGTQFELTRGNEITVYKPQ